MDQTWVLLEDSLHKMQSDSNKGLSTLGPFGFSYSLKKKKKENHSFLHFAFSVPALRERGVSSAIKYQPRDWLRSG